MPMQPGMMPGAMPHAGVTATAHVGGATVQVGVAAPHGPHVLQMCIHCHNTHMKGLKACEYCVCEKCHGTGYNAKKHKPCKKLKVHH